MSFPIDVRFWFLIVLALFSQKIRAQELPPIAYYDSKEYGAENQNWSISQSEERYIYVANNKGLLEFNGATWQLYPSPNESIFRSVNVVGNRIYTGCYMDFGYWQRNELGVLIYTSLSQKLDAPLIEDEQFWNIISYHDFILFQSLNRIYIFNSTNDSFKIINSKHSITKIFKVNEIIYYHSHEEGLYMIENGASKLITDDSILKTNIIVNVFADEGHLLIQTQENGFFKLKDGQLAPWKHNAQQLVNNLSVYSSLQLDNKNLLLGTISNGLVCLNKSGEFIYKIDQTKGLGNNTVLSLFEDAENNIWLGLDNGINVINVNSPFSIYYDDNGKLGTVYTSIVYDNKLFLGTNQGLFYKTIHSNDEFTFINGTKGQVWCLVELNGTLFCGHHNGTYIVKNGDVELIANTPGTWNIKSFMTDPNILLQGNYKGINILEQKNGTWEFRNKLEGFNISTKFLEVLDKNKIFVSHEYKGVFELEVDDELTQVKSVKKISTLEKGFNSSLTKYNNQILYSSENGVYVYNEKDKSFQKDSIISGMLLSDQYTSGKLIPQTDHSKLWAFSSKNLSYLSPGKMSNVPDITSIPFPQFFRKEMSGYETISYLKDNTYLLGTSTGYVLIDLDKLHHKSYAISINNISSFSVEGNPTLIEVGKFTEFKNEQNNIEFTYSLPEYDKYLEAEYQYQLIGYYDNWSNWSTTPSVLFKNLPFGNYKFKVRGRLGNAMTENVSTFEFMIEKPWYLTNLMIVLYVLSIFLFSIFMHINYRRYYKKQREKLLEKNNRELELKQLEVEQQLMQVENEKLQQDIENKNRELAISTMSLIKKNEFLNTVKEELKNTNESGSLKPVIKFIDRNLNNTDDWKFFQEAFNNADKDFLKKVKGMHPSLTPNDLRLCAYLRLNLTSKEIAPLLNISPKSVEVKRYRLRKKMDLPHDYSLTNYILEI